MKANRGIPRLLLVDAALFCCLIVAYLYLRHAASPWPRPFHFPSGLMTVAMIMFGGAVSFVVPVGERAAAAGDRLLSQRVLAAAVILWLTQIFLLVIEWARLYLAEQVHFLSNPWGKPALGATYYTLSGFQAVHVLAGIIWATSVAQTPSQSAAGSLRLYALFTNGILVVIAFVVIFSATDLQGF